MKTKYPSKNNTVILRSVNKENLLIPTSLTKDHDILVYGINETGKFIWEHMDGTQSVEEIAHALTEEYTITFEEALKTTGQFLKLLQNKDLVTV